MWNNTRLEYETAFLGNRSVAWLREAASPNATATPFFLCVVLPVPSFLPFHGAGARGGTRTYTRPQPAARTCGSRGPHSSRLPTLLLLLPAAACCCQTLTLLLPYCCLPLPAPPAVRAQVPRSALPARDGTARTMVP